MVFVFDVLPSLIDFSPTVRAATLTFSPAGDGILGFIDDCFALLATSSVLSLNSPLVSDIKKLQSRDVPHLRAGIPQSQW
jgi:hypothetical protein